MPTYEFRCPKGHDFEKFYRSISAGQAQVPCPECGETAQRLVSAGAGLVFKGSGFYITDYGKDGKKDQRDAAAKAAKASESKASEPSSKVGSGTSSASSSASGSSTPTPSIPSAPAPAASPSKPNSK